jgi:hypothetical protein
MIFLRNLIECSEVHTKPKFAAHFLDEQDRGSVGGPSRSNVTHVQVLVDKLSECGEFQGRE